MTFHIGQRVVCINPNEWHTTPAHNPDGLPRPGKEPVYMGVYTIVEINDEWDNCYLGFKEITKYSLYLASWFKPVKTTKTGMRILRSIKAPRERVTA